MNVFIGCTASNDIDPCYLESGKRIASILSKQYHLVFGAALNGLMGVVYHEFCAHQRNVIGVTPKVYESDFDHIPCSKAIVTNTVNERTDALIAHADVILFLPGGTGTMSEFFSVLEEKRTNQLHQPIILYNQNHFFDPLLALLEHFYQTKFSNITLKSLYQVIDQETELIEYMLHIEKENVNERN